MTPSGFCASALVVVFWASCADDTRTPSRNPADSRVGQSSAWAPHGCSTSSTCVVATVGVEVLTCASVAEFAARTSPQPADAEAKRLAILGMLAQQIRPVPDKIPVTERWRQSYSNLVRESYARSASPRAALSSLQDVLSSASGSIGVIPGPCFPEGGLL